MASSASYGETVFNYGAQAHRQPGSEFKILVLMAALREGIDPDSTYYTSKPLGLGWLPGYPDYRVETVRRQLQRLDEPHARHARLRQHRLRPARRRRRSRGGAAGGLRHGRAHETDAYPAEALGGLRSASRRSRWRPRSRRSPTAGSASGRPRSCASSTATAASTTRQCQGARHVQRGRGGRGDEVLEANVTGGTGTGAFDRLPRRRQDRHDERLQGRVVRRLHAETVDRGVGRLCRPPARCTRPRRQRRRRHVSPPRSGTTS